MVAADRMPYPLLLEVYARALLSERRRELGREVTFDDVPDATIDAWAGHGFEWIWMLGVWQTGSLGRAIASADPVLRAEYRRTLPDFAEDDVCGSCFAVQDYTVHRDFGGAAALRRLRARLRRRGLRLMLDFVPNHTARDHPWVFAHPGFYVHGSEDDLARAPHSYARAETRDGSCIIAHGRDPHFAGWTDTFQLNYGDARLRQAMTQILLDIAGQCDGVRCDMAMLLLPDVFRRTWRIEAAPFWPEAIAQVRSFSPDFLFLAEVYWDLERVLQREGFDFAYDKGLYDVLRAGKGEEARGRLRADFGFQSGLARFLENHDEARAAEVFAPAAHRAAAVITFLAPGLRFFHAGQLDGHRVRIPMQLRRGPVEATNPELARFYARLLACLRKPGLRRGPWRLLEASPAAEADGTPDAVIAMAWGDAGARWLAVANFADRPSHCRVRLPFPELSGWPVRLADRLGDAVFNRGGDVLLGDGLDLHIPGWGYHLFALETGA